MAIQNDFDTTTYLYVHPEPLDEYRIIAQYEDVYIYKHKSKSWYYISRHCSGTIRRKYVAEAFSQKRMRKDLVMMYDAWIKGNISFQDYYCKLILTESL